MGMGMGVESLSRIQAAQRCVEHLGLDGEAVDLNSPEALAGALRRAASFSCPTTPSRLIGAVEKTARELVDDHDALREQLAALLEAMIGYGDLLEFRGRDEGLGTGIELYLGPPAFVRRQSGSFLLLGIRPEAAPLVGEEAVPLIDYERHVRSVKAQPDVDVEELLLASGLREISPDTWLRSPRLADPQSVIDDYNTRLAVAGPAGEIDGLRVLDPATSVTFYRGRWRPPATSDNGRFVARRPQAYGADLWCYAEVAAGATTRLLDLPLHARLNRGCDEAWWLQAALDAVSGDPQVLRVRRARRDTEFGVIDVFSPIPRWLQRRWDSLATPTRSAGALFSYSFAAEEVEEEVIFATQMLWLSALESDANAQ
jgi:hypothetical protein